MLYNSGNDSLIRSFAFWTRQDVADITGDALTEATLLINRGFEDDMPLLLSYTDKPRWDDPNHGDRPVGNIDIVSGQHDYTITVDANSLDILNLLEIRILLSASATEYQKLTRLTLNDDLAFNAQSPNPSETGVPTHWLERENTLFLYPKPNYAATNGIKLFFEREQYYFTTSDTTKEPGTPKTFHDLPVLRAAWRWNAVNRSEDVSLRNTIEKMINDKRSQIMNAISLRNPTVGGLRPNVEDNR